MVGRQQTAQLEPHEGDCGSQKAPVVTDNLRSQLPLTARELDIIECYLGELLTELLQCEVDEELG